MLAVCAVGHLLLQASQQLTPLTTMEAVSC